MLEPESESKRKGRERLEKMMISCALLGTRLIDQKLWLRSAPSLRGMLLDKLILMNLLIINNQLNYNKTNWIPSKMTQKIINIIFSCPILECQFNLTQYICEIFKSRSVFTTKRKGVTCTKLWNHVKWYLLSCEFAQYDMLHLGWNFTWFNGARSFTWNDFTPFYDHGITEVPPWIPSLYVYMLDVIISII